MKRGERRMSMKELAAVLKCEYDMTRRVTTIRDWCKFGILLRPCSGDKTRVKLEHRIVGGRLETSLEAYERFERKMSEARE